MPKQAYKAYNPGEATIKVIARATVICQAYQRQGYNLTLRQLYYQFVAHDYFPDDRRFWWDGSRNVWVRDPDGANPRSTKNADPNYKWLGSIINDARMGGLLDWDFLEDRTRNLAKLAQWWDPENAMDAIASQYRRRLWDSQPAYVECWVEKEALAAVVQRPSERWFVPYFCCRGYVSQSEMHAAAQRLIGRGKEGKDLHVIHLGDHDPSGIDMTRDIEDRLWLFGADVQVHRIALNMDQVLRYDPPPNPAKITDSRAGKYIDEWGNESWELDALEPAVIDELIEDEILSHLDRDQWDADHAQMESERAILTAISQNWGAVAAHLRETGYLPADNDPEED